ncbi:MAG: hypothetical protein JRJ39_11145 [Deltaproteobacteria bacterium]|nr:hypothetical protein [Deltaproteobacteria bacterium]
MNKPVAIIGIGEMGGVFARGFLKSGHPVYPVNRDMDYEQAVKEIPEPALVLISAAEKDLQEVLRKLPDAWKEKTGLLQNELLPYVWEIENIINPTVMTVWFEKKRGMDVKEILPTTVYGPNAEIIKTALDTLDISCTVINDEKRMLFELVKKNVYVFTINVAGLEVNGTVGELWGNHQELAKQVAGEIMDIQEKLTNWKLPREELLEEVIQAFHKEPDHKCRGRAAPDRLDRALRHAEMYGVAAQVLKRIKSKLEDYI